MGKKFLLILLSIVSSLNSGKDSVEKLRQLIVNNKYQDIVSLINKKNKIINKLHGGSGMNAVHVAVRDHRVDILKLLLSKGGDVTKLTFTNQNVLHFCGQVVSDKDNPCLPVLLEYGIKKLEFNKFNQWLEQENWCGIQPKDQCKDFGKQVQRVVQEHLKKLQEKNLSFHENKK